MHVKNTLITVLKGIFREKYPAKTEADINNMIETLKKQGGSGKIDEPVWKKVVSRMYDDRDSQILIQKMLDLIDSKREAKENEFSANFFARGVNQSRVGANYNSLNNLVGIQPNRKLSREQEMAKKKQIRLESKIRFTEFIKIVLDYQLEEHENFLSKFTYEFKKQDTDCNGILDEAQFRQLIINMHKVCETNDANFASGLFSFDQNVEGEIQSLLEAVDPQNNQMITYSEIV